MTKITYIPGEIACAAIDGNGKRKPVTRTQHIFDDAEGKSQAEVNAETEQRVSTLEESVGTGGSVDERIAVEGAKHYLKSETYSKSQLDNMITTPEIDYKDYDTYADMVAETNHPAGAIYRVANYDGTQIVTNKYAEYSWDGTQYRLMAVRDHGIDDEPTAGSKNLVESGGVSKQLNQNKVDIQSQVGSIIGGEIFPEFNTDIWESGTIDSSGDNASATNRLRTINFLRIKKNCTINKLNVNGYSFAIVFYNENKERIGETTYSNRDNYNTGEASYIRIIFRKNNDSTISVDDAIGHECSLIVNYVSVEEKIDSTIVQDTGINNNKTISQLGTTKALNDIDGRFLDVFSVQVWNIGSYYDVISQNNARRYLVLSCSKGDMFSIIFNSSYWGLYIYYADSQGVITYDTVTTNKTITIGDNGNGRIPTEMRITALHRPDTNISGSVWDSFDVECYKKGVIQFIQEKVNYEEKSNEMSITPEWNYGWINANNGTNKGNIHTATEGNYFYSNPIAINTNDKITIDCKGQGILPIAMYLGEDIRNTWLVNSVSAGSGSGIRHFKLIAPFDCNVVFCCQYKDEATVHRYSNEKTYPELSELCKVNIGAWNFGLFNNGIGTGGGGIPSADVETSLPKVKSLLASINADILFATEIRLRVDNENTLDTYDTLLKQFYPYYSLIQLEANSVTCSGLYSKYPIKTSLFTTTTGNRRFIIGDATIHGEHIGICVIHSLPGADDGNARIADYQEVINYFSDYDKVILAGDFNTYEDTELDVFRNAGWVLGNCGYFGNIDTYKPSSSKWYIDNIITKGINIDTFGKIDDRADVSDHYPVCSKVSFFSE